MSNELVTVATFNTPVEASIVRNRLEADGVRAFLANNATIGMASYLAGAVGGIKLEVGDEDVDRALSILEPNEDDLVNDEDWPAAETDETDEFDGAEDESESPTDAKLSRAFLAAVFGMVFLPIQLYSLWLLLQVAFDSAPMTARNRRQAITTLILNIPVIFIGFMVLSSMLT